MPPGVGVVWPPPGVLVLYLLPGVERDPSGVVGVVVFFSPFPSNIKQMQNLGYIDGTFYLEEASIHNLKIICIRLYNEGI